MSSAVISEYKSCGTFYTKRKAFLPRRVWRYQREVIKIRQSNKDRQHNGQKKNDKRTISDRQNIKHKTKDRVTRTSLKIGGELKLGFIQLHIFKEKEWHYFQRKRVKLFSKKKSEISFKEKEWNYFQRKKRVKC